jgi:hypothetical protein
LSLYQISYKAKSPLNFLLLLLWEIKVVENPVSLRVYLASFCQEGKILSLVAPLFSAWFAFLVLRLRRSILTQEFCYLSCFEIKYNLISKGVLKYLPKGSNQIRLRLKTLNVVCIKRGCEGMQILIHLSRDSKTN